MEIELKKIQFSERMSEETNCFIADLYINGKNAGEAKNEGCGGPTSYYSNSREGQKLIEEAEEYCKSLPKVKYGDMEWDQSLEGIIDELLENYLKLKEEKKRLKSMEKSILIGIPNGLSYRVFEWRGKKLSDIPKPLLQKTIEDLRAKYCKDGAVILNTNLEKLGVK